MGGLKPGEKGLTLDHTERPYILTPNTGTLPCYSVVLPQTPKVQASPPEDS